MLYLITVHFVNCIFLCGIVLHRIVFLNCVVLNGVAFLSCPLCCVGFYCIELCSTALWCSFDFYYVLLNGSVVYCSCCFML